MYSGKRWTFTPSNPLKSKKKEKQTSTQTLGPDPPKPTVHVSYETGGPINNKLCETDKQVERSNSACSTN